MKNTFNREWLENYKIIPKKDNTIYKNYQNPGMSNWDRQMGSLSNAQKGRYEQFLQTIPNELRGLSASEMQKYLQGIDEKQRGLEQQRTAYDNQIQKIKNEQEQIKPNLSPEYLQYLQRRKDGLLADKYNPLLQGWGHGKGQFNNGIIGKPYHQMYFREIGPLIRREMNNGVPYIDAYGRVTSNYDNKNPNNPGNKYLGRFTHNPVGSAQSNIPWGIGAHGADDPVFHVNGFLGRYGEEGYKYAMNYFRL